MLVHLKIQTFVICYLNDIYDSKELLLMVAIVKMYIFCEIDSTSPAINALLDYTIMYHMKHRSPDNCVGFPPTIPTKFV